ncbi:MAG TPA: thioesterase family protein [Burkholderiaceae bacterium]
MTSEFRADFQVTWSDLDANVHLRNTGYLDYAAQTRFLYLAQAGYTPKEFKQANMGPVVFSETITYHRELHFLEQFQVAIHLAGMSESGAKFIMANRFLKSDGTVAAEVRSTGAWFNIGTRKVSAPEPGLFNAMNGLPRTEDFQVL